MKPLPTKTQGLRLLTICFLSIGIVTFLFFQTQATNEQEHVKIHDLLRQSKQIDANLNEEVLALRFRLIGNCDAVVEKVSQLLNSSSELNLAVNRGYPQQPADVAQSLNTYKLALTQKQDLIEKFKSTHAVLNNSLNYYPQASVHVQNQLKASLNSTTVSDIGLLEHYILLYTLTRDESVTKQAESLITKLFRVYRDLPPHVQDEVGVLLKHANSILRRKGEVDALLSTIITLPTQEANDAFYAVEQSHYNDMRRTTSRYRYGIYLSCLVLICYVGFILIRLSRQKVKLYLANELLEQRVERRTQDLQKSQERYEVAVAGSDEGIWDWDLLTNSVYYSLRCKNLLGFTEEEFPNHIDSLTAIIHPDDASVIHAAIQAHLAGESSHLSHDFRLRLKNGDYRWFHGRGQALRDEQGQSYRMAGSLADITERKLLESQLAHAQKLESVGQLATGIAHEINTPIQYIGDNIRFLQESLHALTHTHTACLNLLADAPEGTLAADLLPTLRAAQHAADTEYLVEELPKAVTQSLEGVERVTQIVQAMKHFSHPGTATKTPIDLNRSIDSTLTVARSEWKYLAEMVTDFDTRLPLVACLPGDFNQVILNLIVNAAHAIADVVGETGEKGVITVSTRQAAEWVEVRIADTGTGIPERVRSQIFNPFFTTKVVGKGTGQGLSLAHAIIVEKHEGTLTFETEMGRGTTFILRLPLEQPANTWKEAA